MVLKMMASDGVDGARLAGIARTVRRIAIGLIYRAGSGHPGGCLSAADLLTALYFHEMRVDPSAPQWNQRDRLVLSKGHACPSLYAALFLKGFFPSSHLDSFRRLGGQLQGEPHPGIPGVDAVSGSLGQGLSVAIGMALGLRRQGNPGRVYVMVGDGEIQEGQVWEGAMCAGHYRLENLCGIVDHNRMQSDDLNDNIVGLEPLRAKWEAFNWQVIEIDGHDFEQIGAAFAEAGRTRGRPTMVVAHTLKGKGVSFMEGRASWHGSVKLRDEELVKALCDLGAPEREISEYLDGTIWQGRANEDG